MPNYFTVGRIKKGDFHSVPVARTLERPCCIPFGLFEDVLGIDSDFLSFDDSQQVAFYEKSVVGWAVGSGKFLDCVTIESGEIQTFPISHDFPSWVQRSELAVDPYFSGQSLGLSHAPFSFVSKIRPQGRYTPFLLLMLKILAHSRPVIGAATHPIFDDGPGLINFIRANRWNHRMG